VRRAPHPGVRPTRRSSRIPSLRSLQVPESASDSGIDPGSTRFVGEAEGYDLYLARPEDYDGICVILVDASTDEWLSSGCGGGNGDGVGTELPSGTGMEAGTLRFPDGADRIHLRENVALVDLKDSSD
jgi:hypothetical protein